MAIKFVVHAKHWTDKTYGNTYFSMRIFDLEDKVIKTFESEYGHGSQFEFIAGKWLKSQGEAFNYLREIAHRVNEENCTKKDVEAWGQDK